MVDKYPFAYFNKPTKIGVKWSKDSGGLIYFNTGEFTQPFSYLVNVCRRVELGGKSYSAVNNFLHFWILRVIQMYWLSGFHSIENVSLDLIGDTLFFRLVHWL